MQAFSTQVLNVLLQISNFIWQYPLILLTLAVAITLSVGTHFFQFRYFGSVMKNTFGSIFKKRKSKDGISPFAAACSALASTLGVGNIAGVAVAISLGGPGAVFWMWVVALLGMIVKYGEVALALKYREKDPETGIYKGGIMYYAKKGLGKKWAWLGGLWCLFIFLVEALAPATQTNSLTDAMTTYFEIPRVAIGIVSAIMIAIVLIGGIKRISHFAELVVPFMAVAYVIVALYVIFTNIGGVPEAFSLIFGKAFTGTSAVGGFTGAAFSQSVRWGVARGIYSNEAGNGTAPLAHAAADVDHPAKQAIWGIAEVFVDTIIVCTMTALVILVTGVWTTGLGGAQLTTAGFAAGMKSETAAGIFVSIVIMFFAFTTATVATYYGQLALSYFTKNKVIQIIYLAIASSMAIFGSVGAFSTIWGLADLGLGMATLINLIVIFALRKDIFQITKEYKEILQKEKLDKEKQELKEQTGHLIENCN